ncbi:MAG: glutamyl-tRNA reductase [Gemmataceae bacterium]
MILGAYGLNFRTASVDIREKLALADPQRDAATAALASRFSTEAVFLSTCNRVELYLGRALAEEGPDLPTVNQIAEFFAERHDLTAGELVPLIEHHRERPAVRHVCRVAASLDSLIVGEGQIAAQVKKAYEAAKQLGTTGPLLNALFPHALKAAKRVRTETGVSQGHVSVSSVAVDFAKQVFDRFDDKTVLVIGAGKMARLTLAHLKELRPGRIVVTNRSPEKAIEVASWCNGQAVPWDQLARILAEADVALSATGSPDPIVSKAWYDAHVRPHRKTESLVVLDIAVPRDFDPALHDGEQLFVFNVDDLTRVREQTLAVRKKHVAPAESIVEAETSAFLVDWQRRRSGPVIRQLTTEFDRIRAGVVDPLLSKLNGKLSEDEKKQLEYAFKLFQSQLLHGPIAALHDASKGGEHRTMLDAIRKLFRLND